MSDVKAKVVLITGASSGIGQACARHLARRGYRVFGTSRQPQPVAEEPFGMIPMDVTDEDSARQGVATVLARAGRLDAVVNNAGFGFGRAVEDTSIDEARELFETKSTTTRSTRASRRDPSPKWFERSYRRNLVRRLHSK
jgi:NAD(P)-dependent dehydrogenase (short-subunit alcohol dehydrogenase family)